LELTEEDKIDFNRVKKNLYENQELMSYFNKQNSKNDIKDKFEEEVDDEFLNFINTKLDFYNKMTDDKANVLFKNMLFQEIYNREVRGLRR
jgi:type I restriction enzyme R subunit